MERARNSDSITHMEMLNWTSRTDLSGKLLCCIFFGTPCIFVYLYICIFEVTCSCARGWLPPQGEVQQAGADRNMLPHGEPDLFVNIYLW